MIRPVRPDGTIETGGVFVPIPRRRVLDRIASAAMQRVVLIVAPAGYGKSVALRQYLKLADGPQVRFDVLPDNAGLLGFLRGLSDALAEIAPDARETLAGAYEKNAASASPGSDLALWMHSHLKAYRGVVAIDDLHVAQDDREVTRFLASLIDRTKGRVQWIIASRSTLGLPIGTWLAYGDSDLAIDEHDLKFSVEEARDAARAFRLAVRDEELYELLNLTDGWATAMTFALRSSTRSIELRNISTMTRDMVYRYLAEQVYETLNEEECRFIETAALLGDIDVDIMVRAGFDRSSAMLDHLRQRVAFIHEREPGQYRLHDLFREFALHQLNLRGKDVVLGYAASVARSLEEKGDWAGAVRLYAEARDAASLEKQLEEHGLDLVSRGHADDVERALAILEESGRASTPLFAMLQGTISTARGRYAEGESLLRSSLSRLQNPLLRADAAIRLSLMLLNRGDDVSEILTDILADDRLNQERRMEARAMRAAFYAFSRRESEARDEIEIIENEIGALTDQPSLARVSQRLGFSYMHLGDAAKAIDRLKVAVEISTARGMWSLAARSYQMLSAIAILNENQSTLSLWNAQQAALAANRAGDYYDLQTSLLTILSIETRRGNAERAQQVERQLAELGSSDSSRAHYISSSQAQRHAWNGRFSDAHRLFGSVLGRQAHEADRVLIHSLYTLTLALDGQTRQSVEAATVAIEMIERTKEGASYGALLIEVSRLFVIAAEITNGRLTVATRLLKKSPRSDHEIARCMQTIVEDLLRVARSASYEPEEFASRLETVRDFGLGGYAKYFSLVREHVESTHDDRTETDVTLTPSELRILRALASGMSPKEIAADMGRSVYTIQTHIQNLIEKLGCHGRAEAIAAARRKGFLAAGSNGPT